MVLRHSFILLFIGSAKQILFIYGIYLILLCFGVGYSYSVNSKHSPMGFPIRHFLSWMSVNTIPGGNASSSQKLTSRLEVSSSKVLTFFFGCKGNWTISGARRGIPTDNNFWIFAFQTFTNRITVDSTKQSRKDNLRI